MHGSPSTAGESSYSNSLSSSRTAFRVGRHRDQCLAGAPSDFDQPTVFELLIMLGLSVASNFCRLVHQCRIDAKRRSAKRRSHTNDARTARNPSGAAIGVDRYAPEDFEHQKSLKLIPQPRSRPCCKSSLTQGHV